jgi:hypothetical protein
MFQECSSIWPSESDRRYAPGLSFSTTTYGPAHLDSNFLRLSMRGLRKRTRWPALNSLVLTFKSLHALVLSWYFCKLAIALSLFGSNRSLS